MQRIVHGHYADPNSTRDIIGITPVEFEFLIRVIQQYHVSLLKLAESSHNERVEFARQLAESVLGIDANVTKEDMQNAINITLQQFESDYGISYKFLRDLNQPYPGADYGQNSPQNN